MTAAARAVAGRPVSVDYERYLAAATSGRWPPEPAHRADPRVAPSVRWITLIGHGHVT
jgi:hypothetical protein